MDKQPTEQQPPCVGLPAPRCACRGRAADVLRVHPLALVPPAPGTSSSTRCQRTPVTYSCCTGLTTCQRPTTAYSAMAASTHAHHASLLTRGVSCRDAFKPARPARGGAVRVRAAAVKSSVIREIHSDLSSKRRSAVEVTQHYLDAIGRKEGVVNSFITVAAEQALEQVRQMAAGWVGCRWQPTVPRAPHPPSRSARLSWLAGLRLTLGLSPCAPDARRPRLWTLTSPRRELRGWGCWQACLWASRCVTRWAGGGGSGVSMMVLG